MSNYYADQRVMKRELQELITQKRGEKVKIAPLAIIYGTRFGFGRRVVENALKDFAATGQILLFKDEFEALE